MNDLFRENILEHYQHPRCHGTLEDANVTYEDANPLCGDRIRMDLRIDAGRIEKVRFSGHGCSISQAAASVMTDLVIGQPIDRAMATHEAFLELMQGRGQIEPDEDVLEDGIAFAGVAKFPARIKCALLSWMAFKDAAAQVVTKEEA